MLKNNFLLLGTMSALLVSNLLGAESGKCVGGVCFVNLDKLQPSKEYKKKELVTLETPRYIEENLPQSAEVDKTITIVLDGETITIFPHSTYVMSEAEKLEYYSKNEEKANQDLLVTESTENIEEKILKETTLPSSEYYCEKDRKPLYDYNSGLYECV